MLTNSCKLSFPPKVIFFKTLEMAVVGPRWRNRDGIYFAALKKVKNRIKYIKRWFGDVGTQAAWRATPEKWKTDEVSPVYQLSPADCLESGASPQHREADPRRSLIIFQG